MKNATPDSDHKYASYIKKMGIQNPLGLLNGIRDANTAKQGQHKRQKQYKPTGFGVTRFNKNKHKKK